MLDGAAAAGRARGAPIAVVDVDADPALERAWGERVPVLFAGEPATASSCAITGSTGARVDAALAGAGGAAHEVASRAKIR